MGINEELLTTKVNTLELGNAINTIKNGEPETIEALPESASKSEIKKLRNHMEAGDRDE